MDWRVLQDITNPFLIKRDETFRKLKNASSWEVRFRELMMLGKGLPALPAEFQTDEYRVLGCESNVWIVTAEHDNRIYFTGYSDAKIVRGLISVLISALNGLDKATLNDYELHALFAELKLASHLSTSRTNGLNAILRHLTAKT